MNLNGGPFGGVFGGAPGMPSASMRDDCCQERSCSAYGQRTLLKVEGGESFCSTCGTKMGHGKKFDNELEFG